MSEIFDFNYSYEKISKIVEHVVGLYLSVREDNKNRAKITIKTMLMSLDKKDLNTFSKYYEIFKDTLINNIENNDKFDEKAKNIRRVTFGLLTQIQLLFDNNVEVKKDIVEKGFCNLENKGELFYMFKYKDVDKFIISYDEVQDKKQFEEDLKSVVYKVAKDALNKFF